MSKITDLYDYFLDFRGLEDLLPITSDAERGKNIFFPLGSSSIYDLKNEKIDVLGTYSAVMTPYPSIYDEWQMSLYRGLDTNDETQDGTNINIISYEEAEAVCEELVERTQKGDLPKYNGLKVFAILPTGTIPRIWGSDMSKEIITYAITIRVYHVNPNKAFEVESDESED